MSLSLAIEGTIAAIGETEWARLADGRGLYLSRPWLASVEEKRDVPVHYLVARDGRGRLQGALPAYIVRDAGFYRQYNPVDLFVPDAMGAARKRWFPAVLAGTRAGYANEAPIAPDLPPETARRVRELLWHGLFELGSRLAAGSIALLYLTERGLAELDQVLPGVGPVLFTAAEMVLPVEWRTFEGYLAALRPGRRNSVRREVRDFEEAGFRIWRGRLSECVKVLGPLLASLQRRHGHRAEGAGMEAYLAAQATHLDEQSVVFLASRGGCPAGFSLSYEWQGTLYVRLTGFDYEVLGPDSAYFGLCFHLPVLEAIERGCRSVSLGTESYKAKLLHGARPRPLYSALVLRPAGEAWDWGAFAAAWNAEQVASWNKSYGHYGSTGRLEPA